jgi:hypothetical protein
MYHQGPLLFNQLRKEATKPTDIEPLTGTAGSPAGLSIATTASSS